MKLNRFIESDRYRFLHSQALHQQHYGKILYVNRTASKDPTQRNYLAKGQETRAFCQKTDSRSQIGHLVTWKRQMARDRRSPNLICL
jgi:hypothetical protein